jgi:hypothetical protein
MVVLKLRLFWSVMFDIPLETFTKLRLFWSVMFETAFYLVYDFSKISRGTLPSARGTPRFRGTPIKKHCLQST